MYLSNAAGFQHYRDGETHPIDRERVVQALRATLEFLDDQGIQTILFSPLPSNDTDIGACLTKATVFAQDPALCNFARTAIAEPQALALDFLGTFESERPVLRFDKHLCESGICQTLINDIFIYRDTGHLSLEGADYLGTELNFYQRITSGRASP